MSSGAPPACPTAGNVRNLIPFVHVADVDASLVFHALLGFACDGTMRDSRSRAIWASANSDPTTLEKRRYDCQNLSRGDVSAVITDTGKMVEWLKYSAYGTPFALPAGDTESDGDWDATDSAAITRGYDIRKDADLDGDVDAADVTHADAARAMDAFAAGQLGGQPVGLYR